MASQTMSLSQVSQGRNTISNSEKAMPRLGTHGTAGVRNGRKISASLLRR